MTPSPIIGIQASEPQGWASHGGCLHQPTSGEETHSMKEDKKKKQIIYSRNKFSFSPLFLGQLEWMQKGPQVQH